MIDVSKLVVRKHCGCWVLADDKGLIATAHSGCLLVDCFYYCKIHKVKTIDEIKDRFSNTLVFLR